MLQGLNQILFAILCVFFRDIFGYMCFTQKYHF